ncbi:MAG: hypothetical protein FWD37_05915 [Methanomassiliicoccaceae archaeon]|nr:hypothetical protein [Methanomassiliicoccaceae archaeon]
MNDRKENEAAVEQPPNTVIIRRCETIIDEGVNKEIDGVIGTDDQNTRTEHCKKVFIVTVDEWGNEGINATVEEPVYVMGAITSTNPNRLAGVSAEMRRLYNYSEIKYHDLRSAEKEYGEMKISVIGVKAIGVYIDKNAENNPPWWYKHLGHRSKVHRFVLSELADDIMRDPELDNITIVLDEHTALNQNNNEKTFRDSAKMFNKNLISVKLERSVDGRHHNLIQSGEIVIGAMGKAIRDDIENNLIMMSIRKLTDKNTKK